MAILIRILFLSVIAFVVYRLFVPARPVSITLTCNGVSKSKGISKAMLREVDEFARDELLDGESVKIGGYYSERGKICWVFPKNVNLALAQRFRNFMAIQIKHR